MGLYTQGSRQPKIGAFIPGTIQRLAWAPLWALFGLFGSFEVKGHRNLVGIKGPVIIASNHISELDPLLIVAALPFFSRHIPLFYVSREKGFYKVNWRSAVYGGNFFKMMGAYPGYKGLNDYERALQHHLGVLRHGKSVGIFPMGGIRPRGEPLQPKGGVIYLAHATNAPIIPVSITGAENLSLNDFFGRKRKIRLVFGQPIYAQELLEQPTIEITEKSYSECEAAAKILMNKITKLR